jgi:hypothetical protein
MKPTLGTLFLLLPVFCSAADPHSAANPQCTSTPCPKKVLATQNIANCPDYRELLGLIRGNEWLAGSALTNPRGKRRPARFGKVIQRVIG